MVGCRQQTNLTFTANEKNSALAKQGCGSGLERDPWGVGQRRARGVRLTKTKAAAETRVRSKHAFKTRIYESRGAGGRPRQQGFRYEDFARQVFTECMEWFGRRTIMAGRLRGGSKRNTVSDVFAMSREVPVPVPHPRCPSFCWSQ